MAAYMRSRVIGSDPFEVVAEAKLGGSRRSFGRGASLLASSLSAYPYTQSSRAGNLILSVANVPKGVDTDAIAEALTHKKKKRKKKKTRKIRERKKNKEKKIRKRM
jgi:hypothetical protein